MRKLVALIWLVALTTWVAHAQTHEILRPGAEFTVGAGAPNNCGTFTTMPNAWDAGGLSTSSAISAGQVGDKCDGLTTWGSATHSYTSLTLNVNLACSTNTSDGYCRVAYSTDGGTTYTQLAKGGSFTQQTFTATLSSTQNLANLRVVLQVDAGTDNLPGDLTTHTVWDVWTDGVYPSPPTSVAATPASNGLSVAVTWTNNGGSTNNTIQRCTGAACSAPDYNGSNSYATDGTGTGTSYTDTGVSPGNTYGYKICGTNGTGVGCSGTVNATTPSAPTAPTGLSLALTTTSGGTIQLSWTNGTGATSDKVQRCSGASCAPADLATGLSSVSTSYTDSTVAPNTVYGYAACGVNAVGATCTATAYITPKRWGKKLSSQ